jgi:4-amino-4-deoxy-L-arabinose transferase-like glycosyltransferase
MNARLLRRRTSLLAQQHITAWPWLLVVVALALGLRLVVWRWRELYALGGDEQEYLAQALTLLRERRYVELELMRPPVYTLFLASSIYLFDSLVERLRLVQAIISVATVPLIYWLTQAIARCTLRVARSDINSTRSIDAFQRAPIIAATLMALSYTLAAAATELLSETLFLFGLTLMFCLLLRAGHTKNLWLLVSALRVARAANAKQRPITGLGGSLVAPLVFGVACLLVVLPWTARNYNVYGAPILIDTTGAENLWLDNDPAGRDAVKAQLIDPAIYDDRAARQRLALERGLAVIREHPTHFLEKCWNELQKLFALEHADDMRARPAIWLPPTEVWARLVLGDALWLLLLGAGIVGLWLAPSATTPDFRWVLVPWLLYLALTSIVFHVEPRYRLPAYPALLPYAGWALATLATRHQTIGAKGVAAVATLLLVGSVTLAHRPYASEGWMLARKHAHLWQAQQALAAGDTAAATQGATQALALDETSALSRVVLARAALLDGDKASAERWARAAIAALPAHPHGHLLLGELLRRQQQLDAARAAFGYETASRQDLQAWTMKYLRALPVTRVDVGDLDLGYLRGFHGCVTANCAPQRPPEAYRWTTSEAEVLLTRPSSGVVRLRFAAPRPAQAPVPQLELLLDGQPLATLEPMDEWQTAEVALPPGNTGPMLLALRASTYRPRDYDPASPDGRMLGVQLDWVEAAAR